VVGNHYLGTGGAVGGQGLLNVGLMGGVPGSNQYTVHYDSSQLPGHANGGLVSH